MKYYGWKGGVSLLLISTLAGCANQPVLPQEEAKSKCPTCDTALATATTALSAARKASSEWRLIDKATGDASAPLSTLLATAKKRCDEGEYEECTRIAKRVTWAANAGVKQAADNADAAPAYF
jgi:hypothetical protein